MCQRQSVTFYPDGQLCEDGEGMKTITFYPDGYPDRFGAPVGFPIVHDYSFAVSLAERLVSFSTSQMALLLHPKVKEYDLIRIVEHDDIVEIVNNHDGTYACDRTNRQLRGGHNLFRLWSAGEFTTSDEGVSDGE